MNDYTFLMLRGIVSISIILVMRYVMPYLKYKLTQIIDETTWNAIIKEVKSVEQTIKGAGMGAAKKEEVIARITTWANEHNIKITEEQLSQLIETAVWIMNNEDKANE